METHQLKTRPRSATTTSSNQYEQHRRKKKKSKSSGISWNMSSHIPLEWDDTQTKVVAKKELVGITWSDISPFVNYLPQSYSGLADVFSVPKEIFDLENMTEVLSYKVWEAYLSESDREFLTQFLPMAENADHVVQVLGWIVPHRKWGFISWTYIAETSPTL